MLADLLFPPVCTICGSPGVDGVEVACAPCAAAIERDCHIAYCPTCARTVPPFAVSAGRCHRCREGKLRVAGVARGGPYAGPLRTILRAFKYQRRWTLAAHLARRMATEIERSTWFAAVDALVTVPPWWPRRIFAGDYPPAMLARCVSARVGLPLIPALRRIKGGPSQVGLTTAQRIRNVRGKFALTRGLRLGGATLCLIDDVMTTGATIEECARTLLNAGAERVYAGVVAQVSRDTPAVALHPEPAPERGYES